MNKNLRIKFYLNPINFKLSCTIMGSAKFLVATFVSIISCTHTTNVIKLNFDKGVKKTDVRIKMEVLASAPLTVVFDGYQEKYILSGYGENEWYFTYKDSLSGYLRHFKTNRNDNHTYQFTFFIEQGKVFVDADIQGANAMKKKIEMLNTKASH